METEAAGEENARSNNDDAAATEEEAGADNTAGEEAAKAAAADAGEGLAIALMALRPQERQALRRPPARPPLPQRQAPKSPSQAST